jgi:hypothetical protein
VVVVVAAVVVVAVVVVVAAVVVVVVAAMVVVVAVAVAADGRTMSLATRSLTRRQKALAQPWAICCPLHWKMNPSALVLVLA